MSKQLDREVEKLQSMRSLLERIAEAQEDSDLTSWEDGFLEDIYEVVEKGHTLSDGQVDKLEQIEGFIAQGLDVILNIEVEGAKTLQRTDLGNTKALYVFLAPSSTKELEARLRKRNTEDETTPQRRPVIAKRERLDLPGFDFLVINDNLDTAVLELASIIVAERIRVR